MAVVVDTSILIALERELLSSKPASLSLVTDAVVSTISLFELKIGAILADNEARRVARLEFIANVMASVAVLAFGEREAEEAATAFAQLRRAGQKVGDRDLMIAATALANGHTVLTLNRAEFERIPGLSLTAPLIQ